MYLVFQLKTQLMGQTALILIKGYNNEKILLALVSTIHTIGESV